MLDDSLKEQVCGVFSSLESEYVFDAVLPPASEEGRILADLLEETASCSDKISCRLRDGEPLSFSILKNGKETGVSFRGIPSGHEYTSLLLAVLNADGKGRNLPDDVLLARAAGLRGNIAVTTYVSLDCTKCPDVVQALDIMALYNPRLSHQMVDGALFPEEVERLSVQGVPTVFANGELLHVGRATFGELLGELEARFGLESDDEGVDAARPYCNSRLRHDKTGKTVGDIRIRHRRGIPRMHPRRKKACRNSRLRRKTERNNPSHVRTRRTSRVKMSMYIGIYHSGNRVVTAASPRMTAQNTFNRQPQPLKRAMLFNSLYGILRTSGDITARRREHRRYGGTIKVNRQKQYAGQKAFHYRASNLEQTLSKSDDNLFCTNPNSATSFPIYIKAISSPRPLTAETSFRLFNR